MIAEPDRDEAHPALHPEGAPARSPAQGVPMPMTAVAHIPPRVPSRTGLRAVVGSAEQIGARWLTILGLLTALAAVVALWLVRRERDALSAALRERSAVAAAEIDSLQRVARTREQIIASITAPGTVVAEIAGVDGRAARGRVYWNRAASHWTLVAQGLSALPSGRVYRLWLVGRNEARALAAFTPGDDGAIVGAKGALAGATEIVVSEEPERAAGRPTGTIVLRGASPR